jgi:hypothetical protein
VSFIRNPNSLRDSGYFSIEFYAVEGVKEFLVAKDAKQIRVTANQLTPGNITGLKVVNIGSDKVQDESTLRISFRPVHKLTASSEVEITFPRGKDGSFKIKDSNPTCTLIAPFKNAVENPRSCVVNDFVLTIRNLFGSNDFPENEVIEFGIGGVTNPMSV